MSQRGWKHVMLNVVHVSSLLVNWILIYAWISIQSTPCYRAKQSGTDHARGNNRHKRVNATYQLVVLINVLFAEGVEVSATQKKERGFNFGDPECPASMPASHAPWSPIHWEMAWEMNPSRFYPRFQMDKDLQQGALMRTTVFSGTCQHSHLREHFWLTLPSSACFLTLRHAEGGYAKPLYKVKGFTARERGEDFLHPCIEPWLLPHATTDT